MPDPTSVEAMRIVHVTFGLDVGGQEKLLVEFARHADPARAALHVVSLGTRGRLAGDVEACGWPVTALGAPSGLRPGLVPRLAVLLRRWRADVVHTHDVRALFYAGPAARLARRPRPRVVHTRHGRDVGFGGRRAGAFRRLARLADRFVCVSGEVAELSARQGVDAARIVMIPNGIDVARFADGGPRDDGPAVAVARLSPEKDLANLVRAAAILAPTLSGFRVEIAGDGPCRAELEALAAGLGVDGVVTFLGEVRDVPALLGRARLFVLPSRSEGIPLTVLEAMARGLPVVATAVGGVPEVVVPGETGRLVPPSDPDALAGAIAGLWGDPTTLHAMGRAGRRRAEERFDVRRMVGEYQALYEALLRDRRPAAAAGGRP